MAHSKNAGSKGSILSFASLCAILSGRSAFAVMSWGARRSVVKRGSRHPR